MKKSFFVLVLVFAIVLLLTTVGVAGEGKEKVDVCHITGTIVDHGEEVPIGHVINIAESAYEAHINHGDPTIWDVISLPDGKEACTPFRLMDDCTAGTPFKMSRPGPAVNTLRIQFIAGGDPQCWGGSWYWENQKLHIARTRTVAYDIDVIENNKPNFMGIVMAGDLTNSDDYHEMVNYRQLYENSYPGQYAGCGKNSLGQCVCPTDTNYYSGPARVESPVFSLVGNHDGSRGVNYIRHRMEGSGALFDGKDVYGNDISNYYKENYAWEWGSVHCIALGCWAFDGDATKKEWLKEHLKQIGKKKPILLFQHYGFDTSDWSLDNKKAFINVICDREGSDDVCNPYNVVALFTGHTHKFDFIEDILDGQGPRDIPNFISDDAGMGTYDSAGYYFVTMDVDQEGNGHISVSERRFGGDGDKVVGYFIDWDASWGSAISTFYTPSFIRFTQGEPNNSGTGENCCEMLNNGRYNDVPCEREYHALCYDWMSDHYTFSEANVKFEDAWDACNYPFTIFTEPKTPGEQRRILDQMQSQGVNNIWVNYSDQRKEGHFEEIPFFKQYFSSSQPNNGDLVPDWSFGENCAHLEKHPDGTINLNDTDCETGYSRFQCWDVANNTFMVSEAKGYWAQGWDVCTAEGYEFNSPTYPGFYEKMLNEISCSHLQHDGWPCRSCFFAYCKKEEDIPYIVVHGFWKLIQAIRHAEPDESPSAEMLKMVDTLEKQMEEYDDKT